MPIATAITLKMKSSFELVLATCQSNQGKTRFPTTSISAIKIATLPKVSSKVVSKSGFDPSAGRPACIIPSHPASGGNKTRTRTIARSSTTSQPTAIDPLTDLSKPRCSSARSSTTVLAVESATPNTMPRPGSNPRIQRPWLRKWSPPQSARSRRARQSAGQPEDRSTKNATRRRTSAVLRRFPPIGPTVPCRPRSPAYWNPE